MINMNPENFKPFSGKVERKIGVQKYISNKPIAFNH